MLGLVSVIVVLVLVPVIVVVVAGVPVIWMLAAHAIRMQEDQARAAASSAATPLAITRASAATLTRRQPFSRYSRAVAPSAECTPTGLPAAAQAAQICSSAGRSTLSCGSSSQPSEYDRSRGPT